MHQAEIGSAEAIIFIIETDQLSESPDESFTLDLVHLSLMTDAEQVAGTRPFEPGSN